MLELSDPRWKALRGGYKVSFDASVTLTNLPPSSPTLFRLRVLEQ